MEHVLFGAGSVLIAILQALPLRWVASLGRAGGGLAYWLDGRHRRVALANVRRCFGSEWSAADMRALARENFRRIGENYACAVKTAGMSDASLFDGVLECAGMDHIVPKAGDPAAGRRIIAVGHFGNFELLARISKPLGAVTSATTYRGLRQPSLNRLLERLRAKSGCLFFERRTGARELREAMARPGLMLGLLSDQRAGEQALWLPFFGLRCSTTPAPALFALRYDCPLHTCICYRTGPGRWRIEMEPAIPTRKSGVRRSVEDIMTEVNTRFEAAVRRDPANWFWVHDRWKTRKRPSRETAMLEATPHPEPQS